MMAADLRAITRGLHEAATSANQMIAQQYIRLFDQFFDYNPEALGTPMKARMVEVALDQGHHMQVPLISLVTPRGWRSIPCRSTCRSRSRAPSWMMPAVPWKPES
ncbi:DUF2589 domain-containing protein [Pseudomonas sp. KNUC1026]|uniref:DUF2589 domain-containing protein n=1 Tax=Pseudomonas sp. KNUC1026 TaxID=2893890 RepID=UPI002E373413|nr:DUF2589 domain-containing protein [Pseudomonas sp. KNUC1026]